MKVKDLITALQDFNPDALVGVSCENSGDPHPIVSVGLDRGLARLGLDSGTDYNGETREFVEIGGFRNA